MNWSIYKAVREHKSENHDDAHYTATSQIRTRPEMIYPFFYSEIDHKSPNTT